MSKQETLDKEAIRIRKLMAKGLDPTVTPAERQAFLGKAIELQHRLNSQKKASRVRINNVEDDTIVERKFKGHMGRDGHTFKQKVYSDSIFNNRRRAAGLRQPPEPETFKQRQDRELRNMIHRWREQTKREDIAKWHSIIYQHPSRWLKLFFYADQWMFLEYSEGWEKVIRKSKIYRSKNSAEIALKLGIAF